MDAKVVRAFIRTLKAASLLCFFAAFQACDDDPGGDHPVPAASVNLTINTDLPTYFKLKNLGSYVYEDGGNRGILVIHGFDDQFYAFDRLCTHLPDLTCSLIHVDSMNLNLRCGHFSDTTWVPCCESKYQMDGLVQQGPAKYPLRQYPVAINGSILYIRN